MSSARTAGLFLFVHASNLAVGILFVPFCYLVLLSPLIVSWTVYGPFYTIDYQRYWPFAIYVLPRVLPILGVLVLLERAFSALSGSIASNEVENPRPVPARAYWVPGLNHVAEIIAGGEAFWKRARDNSSHPVFALILAGKKHNVVFSLNLIKQVENAGDAVDIFYTQNILLRNLFGLKLDEKVQDSLFKSWKSQLHKGDLGKQLTRRLEQELPNLVSFMPNLIDQLSWERNSGVQSDTDGDGPAESTEANLFALTREFLSYMIASSILGTAFVNNYPQFAQDLALLDLSFFTLGAGIPRFVPTPGLVSGSAARLRLTRTLTALQAALELSSSKEKTFSQEWGDTNDASSFILTTSKEALDRGLSLQDRAKATLVFLWHFLNVTVPLSSWLLYRLLVNAQQDTVTPIASSVIQETAAHAKASQSAPVLGMSEPPIIRLAPAKLLKCETLRDCILETVRLDYCAWKLLKVREDVEVSENTSDAPIDPKGEEIVWLFQKKDWIHLAGGLYHSDPRHFENPDFWQPGRHQSDSKHDRSMLLEPVQTGGDESLTGLAASFVAGVLALWNIELLDKSDSVIGPLTPGGWRKPVADVRIRLKRRKLEQRSA